MEFATTLCCNLLQLVTTCWLQTMGDRTTNAIDHPGQEKGRKMYSILILVCSTALSHADCQAKTAIDVVRGPRVDNAVMCFLNAQTMVARTDLVQAGGAQYMKVVCRPSKSAEEWVAEIEARKAALQ